MTGADVCSLANGHPETGGYYIVGVSGYKSESGSANQKSAEAAGDPVYAHEDPDDPSTYGEWGQIADDTTWTKNPDKAYPDGMPKECIPWVTSMFSDCSSYGDTTSVLSVHVCSMMRFSFTADSSSTVWKMKDNETFQACDFTDAVQITAGGTLPSGRKYVEHAFDVDAMDTNYFFASQDGCTEGQKVVIRPFAEYTGIYDQCSSMGAGSSRIQHCDCNFAIRPHTNNEICLTGFIDGCRAQEPDDRSCCADPEKATSPRMGTYTNGGNCIPKNKKDDFMKMAKELYDKCTNAGEPSTACDDYKTGDCPWETQGSAYMGTLVHNTIDDTVDGAETVFDPHCNPWYMIHHCTDLEDGKEVGAGLHQNVTTKVKEDVTADSCGQSQILAAYKMYVADQKKAEEAGTTAPNDAASFTAVAALGLTLAALA
jgi:hypothetical protein